MTYKKIKKKLEELKAVIITANRLYYLLILYSDENIAMPEEKNIMKGNSIIAIKYNIYQMEEYIIELDIINKKLMKQFNNCGYSIKKDELDYLLDYSSKDISVSSIDINEIPEFNL